MNHSVHVHMWTPRSCLDTLRMDNRVCPWGDQWGSWVRIRGDLLLHGIPFVLFKFLKCVYIVLHQKFRSHGHTGHALEEADGERQFCVYAGCIQEVASNEQPWKIRGESADALVSTGVLPHWAEWPGHHTCLCRSLRWAVLGRPSTWSKWPCSRGDP